MFVYSLLAFAIGSIPFGKIAKRIAKNNVIHNLKISKPKSKSSLLISPFIILLVSIFDIAKIYLIITLSYNYLENFIFSLFLALLAIVGDCFSPLLKYKGNSGIAAIIGFLLATKPISIPVLIVLSFIVLTFNKYPHISSLITITLFPLALIYLETPPHVLLYFLFIAFVVGIRHIENIKRYFAGNELTLKEWFENRNG